VSAAGWFSDELSLKLALVALASGLGAGGGLWLVASLDAFAPCRAPYRMAQTVYDSLACQTSAAISLFSLLLMGVAVVAAIVAAVRVFVSRKRRRNGRGSSS
jgi:hypothetical protein